MLTFEPNVVVIDDKQDEIQGILDIYREQGVGCKFCNADLYEGDGMPDKPYSDVNLIFLDLFFSEAKFDAELCSNWVQSIVPEKSFYVLIIWSKDPANADEVLSELKKLNRLPFTVLVKNKTDFPLDDGSKYDYSKLFQEITDDVNNIPSLAEIGTWKKCIKGASNIIIGNLSKNNDPILFNAKLQKIIVGHGGTSLRENKDDKYKRRVLFDALDQVLISNTRNSFATTEINQINKDHLYSLKSDTSAEIDKELNSWFHFKIQDEIPKDSILPGLICANNHSFFRKIYSIIDDTKLFKRFEKQVGDGIEVKDIVLVLTRPCDIAQGKFGKNIKLVSGVLIKNPCRIVSGKKKGDIDFNGSLPDSTKVFDHLHFDSIDHDIVFIFDFRYVFSVPEKIFIDKFDNIKIFNKELLSEMQVEYSSYSSRLGITQII
ncbi:MAG TPA: hypothetical protein VFM70_12245 [Salinimicrobium sp.]|nr:hypothetical protein [Salinimicrobium sp.]